MTNILISIIVTVVVNGVTNPPPPKADEPKLYLTNYTMPFIQTNITITTNWFEVFDLKK